MLHEVKKKSKKKAEKPLLHTKADSPCDPPALENRSMLKHLEASPFPPWLVGY